MPRKQATFNVDREVWEAALEQLEHGEMSERLRQFVEQIAFGAEVNERKRLMQQMEHLRSERSELEGRIANMQRMRDNHERKISNIEQRLSQLDDRVGKFEGAVETIEELLFAGGRITVDNPQVERAAIIGEVTEEEVIETIRNRNPEVPDIAYRYPEGDEQPNWRREVEV